MKRRKKGLGYYLYAFLAFGFFLANIVMIFLLLFHVREIEVKGNDTSHVESVARLVRADSTAI